MKHRTLGTSYRKLHQAEITATEDIQEDHIRNTYIYNVCPYCGAAYIEDNSIKHIEVCLECSKGILIKGIKSASRARKLSRKGRKHYNVINRLYRNNILSYIMQSGTDNHQGQSSQSIQAV